MPISVRNQINDPILTNEKVLSAKWMAYFNSNDFVFTADVSHNGGLK